MTCRTTRGRRHPAAALMKPDYYKAFSENLILTFFLWILNNFVIFQNFSSFSFSNSDLHHEAIAQKPAPLPPLCSSSSSLPLFLLLFLSAPLSPLPLCPTFRSMMLNALRSQRYVTRPPSSPRSTTLPPPLSSDSVILFDTT